jgi:CRISPR-associated protein Cas2
MKRALYIIAYDIESNNARRKIAALLQTWRMGGQFSVAEVWLTQTEFKHLWKQLTPHMNAQTDRLLALHQDHRGTDSVLGTGRIYAGQTLIVG